MRLEMAHLKKHVLILTHRLNAFCAGLLNDPLHNSMKNFGIDILNISFCRPTWTSGGSQRWGGASETSFSISLEEFSASDKCLFSLIIIVSCPVQNIFHWIIWHYFALTYLLNFLAMYDWLNESEKLKINPRRVFVKFIRRDAFWN